MKVLGPALMYLQMMDDKYKDPLKSAENYPEPLKEEQKQSEPLKTRIDIIKRLINTKVGDKDKRRNFIMEVLMFSDDTKPFRMLNINPLGFGNGDDGNDF